QRPVSRLAPVVSGLSRTLLAPTSRQHWRPRGLLLQSATARADRARTCSNPARLLPDLQGRGVQRKLAQESVPRARAAETAGRGGQRRTRRRLVRHSGTGDEILDGHQLAQMDPTKQRHLEGIPGLRGALDLLLRLREQIKRAQQVLAREAPGQRLHAIALAFAG